MSRRGQVAGAGQTVGVVDTGLTSADPEMGASFTSTKGVTPTVDFAPPLNSGADFCDHGTRMAAVAVAPENGASIVGIAKGAGLFSSRIGNGVVQLASPPFHPSRLEIGLAIERAAAASTVVTLAWGMLMGSQSLADSITTASTTTEAVLLAAAGTSLPANISVFPATMKNEVVGVSAIAPRRGTQTEFWRLPPGSVSYNDTVDILGVASVDNEAGPSLGLNPGQLSRFGGSSSATAQLAGIFAVSAGAFRLANGFSPTREQLINRVFSFAFQEDKLPLETFVDGRSIGVGFGLVNSFAAVGGLVGVSIGGPRNAPAGVPFTLIANPVGDAPFSFEWRMDGLPTVISTSRSITTAIAAGTPSRIFRVSVTAGGSTRSAEARVFTAPTQRRVLFSNNMVTAFATFFDGRRLNQVLNSNLVFPDGCSVVDVSGQEYTKNAAGQIVPLGTPLAVNNWPNRGFTITRPDLSSLGNRPIRPNEMAVHVHAWHDGVSAVRVRPVYLVDQTAGVNCRNGWVQDQP
jgi:hypothetical protein